jgi:hypothetical protein
MRNAIQIQPSNVRSPPSGKNIQTFDKSLLKTTPRLSMTTETENTLVSPVRIDPLFDPKESAGRERP